MVILASILDKVILLILISINVIYYDVIFFFLSSLYIVYSLLFNVIFTCTGNSYLINLNLGKRKEYWFSMFLSPITFFMVRYGYRTIIPHRKFIRNIVKVFPSIDTNRISPVLLFQEHDSLNYDIYVLVPKWEVCKGDLMKMSLKGWIKIV